MLPSITVRNPSEASEAMSPSLLNHCRGLPWVTVLALCVQSQLLGNIQASTITFKLQHVASIPGHSASSKKPCSTPVKILLCYPLDQLLEIPVCSYVHVCVCLWVSVRTGKPGAVTG